MSKHSGSRENNKKILKTIDETLGNNRICPARKLKNKYWTNVQIRTE